VKGLGYCKGDEEYCRTVHCARIIDRDIARRGVVLLASDLVRGPWFCEGFSSLHHKERWTVVQMPDEYLTIFRNLTVKSC
jgi:hypothetical protein